jgi:uncharacterized delta-60 repeat protein
MRCSFGLLLVACVASCTGTDPELAGPGTGGPGDGGESTDGGGVDPTKSLVLVDPAAVSVVHGTVAKVKVTVARSGFTGAVIIEASSPPLGVRIDPVTVGEGANEVELAIDAAATAPQAIAKVKLEASRVGGTEKTSAFLALTVRGRAGELDTTFGGGSVPAGSTAAAALATDASGALYVLSSGGLGKCVVRRFTRDGQVDMAFATAGIATVEDSFLACRALAVQDDGKVIVAGFQQQQLGTAKAVRILANGLPDDTFGTAGVATVSGLNALSGVAIDSMKRIVVTGRTGSDAAVRRLSPTDGSEDSTFAATAIVETSANAFLVAGNGTIHIAGASGATMAAVRIDANGNDPIAKEQSVALDYALSATERGTHLAIDATGALFVGGVTQTDTADRFLVARVASGAQDMAYGNGGWFQVPLVDAVSPGGVLAEASGHLLLVGAAGGASPHVILARVKADGTIETAFGTNGIEHSSVEAISVGGATLQDAQVAIAASKASGEAVLVRYWR